MRRHLTAILLLLSATFRHFLRRQMHRLQFVPPARTTLEPVPPCTPGVASAAQAEIGRNVNVEPIVGQVFDIHRASDGHLYVSDASAHPSSYSIRPAELGQIPELTFDAEGRVYNLSYRGFAQSLMEAVGGRSGVRVRGQVALTRWNVDDGDWTVLAQVPGIEVFSRMAWSTPRLLGVRSGLLTGGSPAPRGRCAGCRAATGVPSSPARWGSSGSPPPRSPRRSPPAPRSRTTPPRSGNRSWGCRPRPPGSERRSSPRRAGPAGGRSGRAGQRRLGARDPHRQRGRRAGQLLHPGPRLARLRPGHYRGGGGGGGRLRQRLRGGGGPAHAAQVYVRVR